MHVAGGAWRRFSSNPDRVLAHESARSQLWLPACTLTTKPYLSAAAACDRRAASKSCPSVQGRTPGRVYRPVAGSRQGGGQSGARKNVASPMLPAVGMHALSATMSVVSRLKLDPCGAATLYVHTHAVAPRLEPRVSMGASGAGQQAPVNETLQQAKGGTRRARGAVVVCSHVTWVCATKAWVHRGPLVEVYVRQLQVRGTPHDEYSAVSPPAQKHRRQPLSRLHMSTV